MQRSAFFLPLAVLATGLAATPASANAPPRFPAGAVWNQDVSSAPLHPNSASMISTLAGLGGFGYGRMQIDFGMNIVNAPVGAPMRSIIGYPSTSAYYAPDCEAIGTQMPVPANSAIEATTGLSCDNANEDCHLLVVQGNKLFEAYRANGSGGSGLQAQCLAVWKLDAVYPINNRGEHCTSADAAGFPIAPLLFNADEVYAAKQVPGSNLGHAIRFILPNARMASQGLGATKLYVHPASHAGGPSGPEASVPYGSRLRLRADFPVNLYNPAAQVILRTMQHYGIVLADGGNIALTAESDLYTTHTWAELGIGSRVFDADVPGAPVRIQDFAVVDTGPRIVETYDCVRNPDPVGNLPTISIADSRTNEGNSGSKPLSFKVSLSKASTSAVGFKIWTSNGLATAGSDYASASAVLSIPPGSTSANFAVTLYGDTVVEPNENFVVNLSNVTGATVADGLAQGVLVNDDGLPMLSIADASISEGPLGSKNLNFTVRLSAASTSAVGYSIATGNLSAVAGSDYKATSLTGQVIPAGSTSKVFSVPILGDAIVEPNETFSVTVSQVTNASVADGYAVGTILNDD
jgi:serine/threonine-protein kinase